jgi:uncharacterized protein (DUF4415 family)
MKTEYDFSDAKRGAIRPAKGKTRITLYLDDAVLEAFRLQAQDQGLGYQTLINEALRDKVLTKQPKPVTVADLRRVLREELHAA